MVSVGSLYATLKLDASKFREGLQRADGGLGGFAKHAATLAIGLGAAFVGAFAAIAKRSADFASAYGVTISKVRAVTGLSVTAASRLVAVFARFHIEGDAVIKSLGMLQKNVGNLTVGIKVGADATEKETDWVKKWGFALRDSSGRVLDANKLILQAADYFNKNIPASKRAALEAKLFGKSWQTMIPILALGSKGITDAADAAAKLGLVLNESNVKDLAAYRKATLDLGEAWAGFKLQLGIFVMPTLTALVTFLTTRIIPAIRDHLIPDVKDLAKRVGDWYSANKPLIDQIKTFATGALSKLVDFLKGAATWLGKLGDKVSASGLPGDLKSLAGHVVDLATALGKPLIDGLKSFADWFTTHVDVPGILDTLVRAVDGFVVKLSSLTDWVERTPAARTGLLAFMGFIAAEATAIGIARTADSIGRLANSLATLFGTAGLGPLLTSLPIALGLFAGFAIVADENRDKLKDWPPVIRDVASAILDLRDNIATFFKPLGDLNDAFFNMIDSVGPAVGGFVTDVLAAWDRLKKGIGGLADGIGSLVTSAISAAISIARGIINDLIAKLNTAIKLFNDLPIGDLPYIGLIPAPSNGPTNQPPSTLGTGSTATGVRGPGGTMSFQHGTPFVPFDMLALIHRGEAVVPAAMNPYAGRGDGGRLDVYHHVKVDVAGGVLTPGAASALGEALGPSLTRWQQHNQLLPRRGTPQRG